MIATFFVIFHVYCTWTTYAFEAERYSTSIQDEKQLPQELSTCHEVILVQSVAINDLAKERDQRLIEKMLEAKKDGKSSLDAKMRAYSGCEDRPYDIFDFRVSRHRDGPAEFLASYSGHVMADCYSGNLSVVLDASSSMTRMACMSHARRKIFEAKDVDRVASAYPLALIGQLYDIERMAIDMTKEERTDIRQRESKLILNRLGTWLGGELAKSVLPASQQAWASIPIHA